MKHELSKDIIPALGNRDLIILTIEDLYNREKYPSKTITLFNLNINEKVVYCENVCPYGENCDKFKDPTGRESLENFCGWIGDKGNDPEELKQCFPTSGTIEAVHNPGATDYYQAALESKFSKEFCNNKCQFRCHDERCSIEKGNCNLRDNIKVKRITIKR
jgi:hypothetical protein